jgi:hypothetical protein
MSFDQQGMWNAHRPASVHCDIEGCQEYFRAQYKNSAREEAKLEGWGWRKTTHSSPEQWEDYCPKHVAEEIQKNFSSYVVPGPYFTQTCASVITPDEPDLWNDPYAGTLDERREDD